MRSDKPIARASLPFALALFALLPALAQAGPYVIRSVDFKVQGRTLPFVLMQKIEADGPVIGKSFDDEASLDGYIEDRRQVLVNNRVLASVAASRDIAPGAAGGSDAAVVYSVVDTWNLVALPEPKYDSNKGLTLYVKARDYNFAGSMQTLILNLSYVSDTASNKSFEVATTFNLPFQALGAIWTLGVSEDFQVWTDGTLRSGSTAGLTYGLPGLGFPASVTAAQSLNYNADAFQDAAAGNDPWFLGESLSFNATIPLRLRAGSLGQINYGPALSVAQNWWPTSSLEVYGRPGLSINATNGLGAGRVDWIGNMQRGANVQFSSANSYNIQYQDFIWTLSASVADYATWDRRLGLAAKLSTRVRAMGHFPADNLGDLGSELRGVLDSRATGVAGLYANLSLPVKLFDFPAHLLIKKNWLDFELQVQPFLDAGLVDPAWGAACGSDWLWASGGLEFLVFPAAMRSFIIRASVGWDLGSVVQTRSLTSASPRDGRSPYEIYFGTGLAY